MVVLPVRARPCGPCEAVELRGQLGRPRHRRSVGIARRPDVTCGRDARGGCTISDRVEVRQAIIANYNSVTKGRRRFGGLPN